MKKLKSIDFYVSIGLVLFFCVTAWQITIIENPESRMLPLIALLLVGLSSIVIFCERLFSKSTAIKQDFKGFRKIVLVMILLLMFYFFSIFLGFYISVFLLVLGVSFVVTDKITVKGMKKILIYCLGFFVVTYILFAILLKVYIPEGLLV